MIKRSYVVSNCFIWLINILVYLLNFLYNFNFLMYIYYFLFILAVYSGCRMGFYEYLRDHVLKKDPDGYFPLW